MALPTPRNTNEVVERAEDRGDPRRQAVAWLNSENIKEQVERALPNHVPFDWFLRIAQTAILNNPGLAAADKASLLRELVAVAQLGLVLDPQLGEAWLIVDNKGKVQRRIGYQGLRKLALQSGKVTALNAQAVYENDRCEISLGDAPSVKHSIDIKAADRGKVIGCYAVGKVEGTNEPIVEWMSWKQIEDHRDRYSDAGRNKKSGPWADSLGEIEMGRKTAFRRLCKWLPKSPLLLEALTNEDRLDAMRDVTPSQRANVAPAALPAPEDVDDGEQHEQQQEIPTTAAAQASDEMLDAEKRLVTYTFATARETEPAGDRDKPSWTIDGKSYVQPGRVQAVLIGKIEGIYDDLELSFYEDDNQGAEFIRSLPAANRKEVEQAVLHQRSVIDAERARTPEQAGGEHPMAELDHLEDESFRKAGEQPARKGGFDLLSQ
jgi:recombination protein RecT